jgi:D-alanine transaminase
MSIVYLNGEFLPKEEAKISPQDRGFLFGDAVYEAIPFYQGKPFGMELHWKRLQDGLGFMRIPFDETQESFLQICENLLAKNQFDQKATIMSMIYLQISRGTSMTRHHLFPKPEANNGATVKPTVYAFLQEINYPSKERWNQGFTAALVPDRRWDRVDIKTVNLLPNVLAFQDAKEQGADECILVKDGVAMEGAHNNFWAVLENDVVVTHPLTNRILPGITRGILLEVIRAAGIAVEERPLHIEELRDKVKEAFFTSTTSEVKPAVSIDGIPVGSGKAGDMTRRLHKLFLDRIERDTGVSLSDR